MSTTKKEPSIELKRLIKSLIEMDDRTEALWLGANFLKCNLDNIEDIDWKHIDPINIFEIIYG